MNMDKLSLIVLNLLFWDYVLFDNLFLVLYPQFLFFYLPNIDGIKTNLKYSNCLGLTPSIINSIMQPSLTGSSKQQKNYLMNFEILKFLQIKNRLKKLNIVYSVIPITEGIHLVVYSTGVKFTVKKNGKL